MGSGWPSALAPKLDPVAGRRNHRRTHRVELDIALAGRKIPIGFDRRRPETSLEQSAGAPVGTIDLLHVALPQSLHDRRNALIVHRCQQQLQMVGHQHVHMNRNGLLRGGGTKAIEEEPAVAIALFPLFSAPFPSILSLFLSGTPADPKSSRSFVRRKRHVLILH
jgi:hypothetical protein